MLKYLIPLYYTIHSRSKGIHFLSYFLMVVLPPLFILLSNAQRFNFINCVIYCFAFLGMLSIYEIGYIWNDAVCIKKDPSPTKRINDEEIDFINKNIWCISFFKVAVSTFFVFILFLLDNNLNILFFSVSLFLLLLTYVFHNYFRSWVNYFTVFILTTLNYSCSLILFAQNKEILFYFLTTIILFSIPKTFFYIVRKVRKTKVSKEGFKFAFYYFICFLISLFLFFKNIISIYLVVLPAYLFLYRFSINFLISIKSGRK